jgi:hypothetical protein
MMTGCASAEVTANVMRETPKPIRANNFIR